MTVNNFCFISYTLFLLCFSDLWHQFKTRVLFVSSRVCWVARWHLPGFIFVFIQWNIDEFHNLLSLYVCVCVCPMKNHQRRVIGLNTNNYPEPCSEEAAGTGYTVPTNNLAYVWTRKVFWMDEVYYSTAIELVLTSRYTLWVYLLAHSSV